MRHDDETLVRKILRGNRLSKQKLYDRYESYWFKLAMRYSRDRHEAQDIFQEGALKLFQVLDKYDSKKGQFLPWANRVMVNQALKYLNKHQWNQSFDDLKGLEGTEDDRMNAYELMGEKEIILLIQSLPSGYRLVFNMYEIEGYSHKEIAEKLNIRIGTSKSQLSKAKGMLRKKIDVLINRE